jgi:nucleotide-binding universal stress UspA family protein
MATIKKILFPTDFSDCANQAMNHAIFLAEQYGAALHLLHAVVLHADLEDALQRFPEAEDVYARVEKMAQGRAAELLAPHRSEALVVKEVQRRGVAAAEVILEYAEEEGVDLIVLGTHGRRGLGHLFLGSVAEEVVRLARCPVLTLRQQEDPRPVEKVKKILVPVDFSDHAAHALDVAAELATRYDGHLELLHVVQPPAYPELYYPGQGTSTSLMDIPLLQARTHEALVDLIREKGLEGKAKAKVIEGYPGTEIPRYAKEAQADLLVLSTQGLTGLKHLVLGSVAEKVVRLCECPVLTVKGSQGS